MAIFSQLNHISINGELASEDAFRLLAAMHNIIEIKGFRDFTLDFSACTLAYAAQMIAICAKCQSYWKNGIDIRLVLPKEERLNRLFINTNWAYFIDVRNQNESSYKGYTHSPVIRFNDGKEQTEAINKILDILLKAISNLGRDDLRAIEWAINEIADNVINHAQSSIGGLIQITNYRNSSQIEFVVCDCGLGIPNTLRSTHKDIRSDAEALARAVEEGVTRDKSVGQGNGLYGSLRVAKISKGKFQIFSGRASLVSQADTLHTKMQDIPLNGTLIVARVGYSQKINLSDAIIIKGKQHLPTDYIETHFEQDEAGNALFVIKNESDGFGSRAVAAPIRTKLINVMRCMTGNKIIIDFSDVHLISSSFADEVFGKLFVELGPIDFMQRLHFIKIDPLVKDLIDKAIMQRMKQ